MNNEKFENLKKWIKENGGIVSDKISINCESENRHIYATEKIEKEEKILEIPPICCIKHSNSSDIKNLDSVKRWNDISVRGKLATILFYHVALNKNSFFYPYLCFLPKYETFEYHPLYKYPTFSNKTKELCQPIIDMLEILERDILQTQIILLEDNDVFPKEYVTYENIKWCYLLSLTRQWEIGMVPIADLFQHSNDSELILTRENIFKTNKEIQTGEQIYDNYGIKSDLVMYSIYGFIDKIEDKTVKRVFDVSLDFNEPKDNISKIRHIFYEKIKTNRSFILSNNSLQNELIYLMRIASLSENDLKLIDINNEFYKNMISVDNELNTYRQLMNIIKGYENKFNDQIKKNIKMVLTTYDKNTPEYVIAKAMQYQIQIIDCSIKYIIVQWNKMLGSPYLYSISFDTFEEIMKY